MTALRDALLVNKNITLLELSESTNADEVSETLLKQVQEICAQNKYNSQQEALSQQSTQSKQSIDAVDLVNSSQYMINGSDIWNNNVSLTSMNGTSSLSSTPRFSLSELFKPIHTLTTTTASITSSLTTQSTTPPVPPSTPNNQLTPIPSPNNLHSFKNSPNSLLNAQQTELNVNVHNIEDQVKLNMFTMSLDSPNSYLSSSNNSSQSSDLRQYSSSPGSRFKISQVDNKFLRSNSINETCSEDQKPGRSAPISTGSMNKTMMRSCSLGSWGSKYDKNEPTSRSGRFSISPVVSPVPDNEMVSY